MGITVWMLTEVTSRPWLLRSSSGCSFCRMLVDSAREAIWSESKTVAPCVAPGHHAVRVCRVCDCEPTSSSTCSPTSRYVCCSTSGMFQNST